MQTTSKLVLGCGLLGALALTELGCRGYTSHEPPIHLNPNMDTQDKGKSYRASNFFVDGTYMRPQVEGTIARGQLQSDELFYAGIVNGAPAQCFPSNLTLDENFVYRGEQLYNRYCSSCHAQIGDGNGLVGRRLMVRPTSFHSEYMYDQPPGHFFNVISNGIRTMPAYDKMIAPMERWAITAYVRVLQMSQDIDGAWIKRSLSWWKQL